MRTASAAAIPCFLLLLSCNLVAQEFDLSISLTFLDRMKIKNGSEGLTEPSGLVLSRGGHALWTVSDDTRKVFQLGLDGDLDTSDSFRVDRKGFEGITLDAAGEFFYLVKEEDNSIVKVQRGAEHPATTVPLSAMRGFDLVADDFHDSDPNKGLEGITIRPSDGAVFILKEGGPGLLIEVAPALDEIKAAVRLTGELGFVDNDVSQDEIDFSGICYDSQRDKFWIVSDKAKRLYLFDYASQRVVQSFALGYGRGGELREIKKAEGVTFDPSTGRLYVVSDKEARLYVFQVH